MLVALMLPTSIAQAAYLDVGDTPSDGSIDITIEGGQVSVARSRAMRNIAGMGFSISLDVQHVLFNDGPVLVDRVDLASADGSTALLLGPDSSTATRDGTSPAGTTVSEIFIYDVPQPDSSGASTGVSFEWSGSVSSNPVPEPSAALLFSTGLLVAGSFIQRRR